MTADASFAVGLGLTNDCNLGCAHCYRDTGRVDCLSLADVRRVCDSLSIRAINLGSGENALHPEFKAILNELHARGLIVTLTSNGYSTSVLDDEGLRWLHPGPRFPQRNPRSEKRSSASTGFTTAAHRTTNAPSSTRPVRSVPIVRAFDHPTRSTARCRAQEGRARSSRRLSRRHRASAHLPAPATRRATMALAIGYGCTILPLGETMAPRVQYEPTTPPSWP